MHFHLLYYSLSPFSASYLGGREKKGKDNNVGR